VRPGLAILRAVTGATMAGHGLQKLAGWFGGSGIEGTTAGFRRSGLLPARGNAYAAAITETAGGLSLLLGLFTPAGAAAITGTMSVAVAHVHGKNGLWVTKGGYEYNLALIAIAFALADLGPGPLALDGSVTKRRAGLGWALAELGAGTAVAALVVSRARRAREQAAAAGEAAAPA